MLRRYAAGSNAGSGGLEIGNSGMDAGGPLPLYPGDRKEVFDVRALLTDTNDSFSSRSDCFESLRLKIPMVGLRKGKGRRERGMFLFFPNNCVFSSNEFLGGDKFKVEFVNLMN